MFGFQTKLGGGGGGGGGSFYLHEWWIFMVNACFPIPYMDAMGKGIPRCWFQTFLFIPIWGNDPI